MQMQSGENVMPDSGKGGKYMLCDKGERICLWFWKLRSKWREWERPEDGFGTVEVILILVVLIALVLIFKKQITELVQNIFKQINNSVNQVY